MNAQKPWILKSRGEGHKQGFHIAFVDKGYLMLGKVMPLGLSFIIYHMRTIMYNHNMIRQPHHPTQCIAVMKKSKERKITYVVHH